MADVAVMVEKEDWAVMVAMAVRAARALTVSALMADQVMVVKAVMAVGAVKEGLAAMVATAVTAARAQISMSLTHRGTIYQILILMPVEEPVEVVAREALPAREALVGFLAWGGRQAVVVSVLRDLEAMDKMG
jgi:hypothetical protein